MGCGMALFAVGTFGVKGAAKGEAAYWPMPVGAPTSVTSWAWVPRLSSTETDEAKDKAPARPASTLCGVPTMSETLFPVREVLTI